MIKNTASQKVGAQLVSATDGSAFTGSVTVAVTVDAGTQATGTVGSGACTHEGGGYHTYAPSQAETNGDLVAFTFSGTGAVPVTVQIYTVAGDAFTRLGAPAGASVSADVAAIKAETATIVADTNELQGDWVNGGRLDLILDARASQTSVDDLPTNAELATSQAAADDATLAAIAALNNPSAAAIADAVWDEAQAGHVGAGTFGEVASEVADILVDTGTTLQAELDGIQADTEDIQTRLPAALVSGRIDASVGAMAANVVTAAAVAADAVTELQAGLSTLDAAAVRGAVGLASANLDTQLDTLPTAAENADAVWDEARAGHVAAGSFGEGAASVQGSVTGSVASVTGNVGGNVVGSVDSVVDPVTVGTNNDKTGYAIGAGGIAASAFAAGAIDAAALAADAVDEILDEQIGDSTITVRQALKVLVASLAGKLSGAATTSISIRNAADDTNVIVATVDADGNRSAVTLTV